MVAMLALRARRTLDFGQPKSCRLPLLWLRAGPGRRSQRLPGPFVPPRRIAYRRPRLAE